LAADRKHKTLAGYDDYEYYDLKLSRGKARESEGKRGKARESEGKQAPYPTPISVQLIGSTSRRVPSGYGEFAKSTRNQESPMGAAYSKQTTESDVFSAAREQAEEGQRP